MKTIRTLCSGGELFGVGARAAGYRHVDGYEFRPDIAAVAQRNGFDVRVADVCTVDYAALVAVDHLHASPSCKTASTANPNAGEAPEDLAVADAVCRAIRAHQGPTFSLENVWPYRHYESFQRIKAALIASGFLFDVRHINAADFGVPQTRKRLILRAVRGGRVPLLNPTHRKGGDMLHAPWEGWYASIADIVHTLPPTEPAPWQQQRLARRPEFQAPTIIGAGGYDGDIVLRTADEPVFTLAHGGEAGSTGNSAQLRALLFGGGNTNLTDPRGCGRDGDDPAFTVRNGAHGSPERALLIDGANGRRTDGAPTVVDEGDPAFAIGANKAVHRAIVTGRWVRMTVQALGRFQTVPDDYLGLTSEINGNGVPCKLARQIMVSLRGVA